MSKDKAGKYKLIKWYPSLPDSWKDREIIVEKRKIKHAKGECRTYYRECKEKSFTFNPDQIENNPEYWEKIEERKYIITSFKKPKSKAIYKLKEENPHKDMYSTNGVAYYSKEECFDMGFEIYSVRRLSDGEEFKVGDRVEWNWLSSIPFVTITNFKIEEGKLYFNIEEGKADFDFINLSISKDFKPLNKLYTLEEIEIAYATSRLASSAIGEWINTETFFSKLKNKE